MTGPKKNISILGGFALNGGGMDNHAVAITASAKQIWATWLRSHLGYSIAISGAVNGSHAFDSPATVGLSVQAMLGHQLALFWRNAKRPRKGQLWPRTR